MLFSEQTDCYLRFLEKNCIQNIEYGTEKIYFYIGPLVGTNWPLWMITFALLCNKYGGKDISFLINDCWEDGNLIYENYAYQTECIKKIAHYLECRNYSVIYLNKLSNSEINENIVEKASNLSAIWQLGFSYKGNGYKKSHDKWHEEFRKIASKITFACKSIGIKKIALVGAGVYDGYLIYRICREYNIETWAYNVIEGIVFEKNGISVQLPNMEDSFNAICESKNINKLKKQAIEILNNRIGGHEDTGNFKGFCFQSANSEIEINKYDYTIFPNCEADAAVLGVNRVFQDDTEWIDETIKFILKNTNKTIAIRQHPAARTENYQAEIFKFIFKKYEFNERVTLFDCFSPVSSYELIKNSNTIIVNTSTIGLEAAYMGKNVLTEAESFYARTGLINYSKTKEEYFNNILNEKRCIYTEKDKEKLLCLYGLRQICGDVAEKFTIFEEPFLEWINGTIEDIYFDEQVKILIDCICKDEKMVEQKFLYLYGDD